MLHPMFGVQMTRGPPAGTPPKGELPAVEDALPAAAMLEQKKEESCGLLSRIRLNQLT